MLCWGQTRVCKASLGIQGARKCLFPSTLSTISWFPFSLSWLKYSIVLKLNFSDSFIFYFGSNFSAALPEETNLNSLLYHTNFNFNWITISITIPILPNLHSLLYKTNFILLTIVWADNHTGSEILLIYLFFFVLLLRQA